MLAEPHGCPACLVSSRFHLIPPSEMHRTTNIQIRGDEGFGFVRSHIGKRFVFHPAIFGAADIPFARGQQPRSICCRVNSFSWYSIGKLGGKGKGGLPMLCYWSFLKDGVLTMSNNPSLQVAASSGIESIAETMPQNETEVNAETGVN